MIAVIDYGVGNVGSIVNMLRKVGKQASIIKKPEQLFDADFIILPGVGSFDESMKKLRTQGFVDVLQHKVIEDTIPFLGICLGMQILFEKSEEGKLEGLGWVKGEVIKFDKARFPASLNLKIPNMGWSNVKFKEDETQHQPKRFYFVHSYHAVCEREEDIYAVSTYGYEFCCAVRKGQIQGVQFHPEKSHQFGINFFKNYFRELECLERA